MEVLLRPSELQSSVLPLLLVGGAALALPPLVNRDSRLHRTALFAVAIALAVRYLWWRGTTTLAPAELSWDFLASWSFFAVEAASVLGSLSAFIILSRVRHRHDEVVRHLAWWGDAPPPKVAVLIATYNEERDVLLRTIVGAKAIDYPDVDIYVCDDKRRDWLRALCAQTGVTHVTRPDNSHAKAGNINHALGMLAAQDRPPDFVAVLDADFVPHREFLGRTLALFHASDVGLVQTPQHFFNPDPIQHNLGLDRSYPDEQRFFFDQLQPSRDAWGIAFCCGTSSVIRWQALRRIGGFPTDSVTEDFMLTLALQDQGWRTVYLDEPLTEGLAPEGLKEYITQRARWCLGSMQIMRSRLGPFSRNRLRLRDRWSLVDSLLFWTTTSPFRLMALVYPLFYWFFGITVVDASVPEVIAYFGVYFCWTIMTLNIVSRGMIVPVVNDVSQLLGAIPITQAAFNGLVRPQGQGFSVTAKGGDRGRVTVQWELMRPFLVLFALTLAGLCIGIVSDAYAYNEAGDGKAVILFWTLYNLIVLAVMLLVCIELPRAERHVADLPERGKLLAGGRDQPVWIGEMTTESASIRGQQRPVGSTHVLEITGVGPVAATVTAHSDDGMRLRLRPDAEVGAALLRKLHAEGGAPGTLTARLDGIVADLARRLSRRAS